MEEIDIIELLQRVKEGKAPKEIEIKGKKLIYHQDETYFERLYQTESNSWWSKACFIELNTKIKILDKPIIEELDYSLEELEETSYNESWLMNCIRDNKEKINEIIRYLRSKDER